MATYREHTLMLGLFVFIVLFSLSALLWFAMASTDGSEVTGLQQELTPGMLATVAFVMLFVRGLVDVQRSVLRDRALWSTLVAPLGEGRVRVGLMLRTVVFQMGLLALVMGTFSMVLLASPDKPSLPRETGPLIVLAGLAAAALPLPFLLSVLGARERSHRVALAVLVALEVALSALLLTDGPLWQMMVAAAALLVACMAVTMKGAPVLATTWATVDAEGYRSSGGNRRLPPSFRALQPRWDPVARALFRREMTIGYPTRQRAAIAGMNVALAAGLVIVSGQLGQLMREEGYEDYFFSLVIPVMVGLGIYAASFFQGTMPLVDGVTREGTAFWVLRTLPVEPWRLLYAKVRPLLAFIPLMAVAVGLSIPFVAGMSWQAMAIGVLGAAAVYLAFLGVGAWAGATYPNLDRHSNAPPDLVLAFYLMFGCLVLEGFLLLPVAAIGFIEPTIGVLAGLVAVLVGWLIMWVGIRAGGRALRRLEVT